MSIFDHDYHSVSTADWRVGLPWPLGPRVEDPVRVKEFADAVRGLVWTEASSRESLDTLFHHLAKLARAEVQYYYMRRKGARLKAAWIQFGTWVLATVGVLVPFIQPLVVGRDILPWGYLSLAIAGALVVADRLFLASEGHGRYTTTQLRIEGAFSEFSLKWCEALLEVDRLPTLTAVRKAIQLAQEFASVLHVSLGAETAEWVEQRKKAQDSTESYAKHRAATPPTGVED